MRRTLIFFKLPAFFTFPLIGLVCQAQNSNISENASTIIQTVEKYHLDPRKIDDDFSELVYSNFTKLIDPYSVYLSTDDYTELEKYKHKIDDDITAKKQVFLNHAQQVYKKRLFFADSVIQSFRSKNINLFEDDSIRVTNNSFLSSPAQQTLNWERILKLQMLSSYWTNADSTGLNQKPDLEALDQLKEDAIARELCRIKSLNSAGSTDEYVATIYLKSIASAFDPHTAYFTGSEKNTFSTMLSKEAYTFGFEITQNDYGEIEISEVIPGGPAWNSGEINPGDVIVSIKGGHERSFDCIGLNEAINFLSTEQLTEANFVIKKESKKLITVKLNKEKITVEDNVISSFVLQGDKKVGYIYLPSFYTQFDENSMANGCANSVATELIKLKKENIEGLILDLRNNGGGSMMEAINMAGIFIDYGAVSIISRKNETPESLKDMNRGAIYNKPLVILINEFSASASELFAAAMQDYNRAIIVGTTSYGKSTMQNIFPLDPSNNTNAQETGYLKITIGAFYRVTGLSHQKRGIVPDVSLPSLYANREIGEKYYPNPIDTSFIKKKAYYYPKKPLPVNQLNQLSADRLKTNQAFLSIKKHNEKKEKSEYSIPLGFEKFKLTYYGADEGSDLMITDTESAFTVQSPSYAIDTRVLTDFQKEININKKDQILSDIYIQESFTIINDLINLQK